MLTVAKLNDYIYNGKYLDADGESHDASDCFSSFRGDYCGSLKLSLEGSPDIELIAVKGWRHNSTMTFIFQVGEQYFRTEGYYDSWNGTSWDDADIWEVVPKEVTVTEYHKK